MPGICGWIAKAAGANPDQAIQDMAKGLSCRPGEDVHVWQDGRMALAVLDRDGRGLSVDDRHAVAITGRPYWANSSLAMEAQARGFAHSLKSAWQNRGTEALDQLRGSFALAVLDRVDARLVVAIDRVGIESLCHSDLRDGLIFASRTDALLAHPDVDRPVGARGIYRYAMNYVSPAPFTIYEGVDKLLTAHALHWDAQSGARLERYWVTPYDGAAKGDIRSLGQDLLGHLEKGVARSASPHMAAGGTVGAFLSGGLDSSTVSGMLARVMDSPAPAYTIVFEEERYNEGPFARMAAKQFGLKHREYCLKPQDVVDLLPDLVRVFDEPFGNSSAIPATYCARMAKEDVSLLLAGDGGDELFAGNKRYAEQKILGYYYRIPGVLRALGAPVIGAVPDALARGPLGKIKRYVRRASLPMPERMHNPDVYTRDALGGIFTADALADIAVEEPYELWSQHFRDAETDDMLASMLHMDMRITLADNDIRKVNGACLLADIDVAYPMLDDDLVDFAAHMPSDMLMKGTRLRHFYKESMVGFLPEPIINKEKQGFGMPFSEWTRSYGPLRDIAVDCLEGLGQRGIFRADFLKQVLTDHMGEEPKATDGIVWDMIMLEMWLRDRNPRLV